MAKNKTAAKGKGSSVRRVEKRQKKFSGGSVSAARANVLRQEEEDLGDDEGPKRKRAPAPADAPAGKRLKQGSFARPAAAGIPRTHAAAPPPLTKAALNERVAVKMAVRKPNAALIQVRRRGVRRRAEPAPHARPG